MTNLYSDDEMIEEIKEEIEELGGAVTFVPHNTQGRGGGLQLYIEPEECIDCGACEPECPVEAIMAEEDTPENQKQYLEINARLAEKWPNITTMKEPPADADKWKDVKDKAKYLEE